MEIAFQFSVTILALALITFICIGCVFLWVILMDVIRHTRTIKIDCQKQKLPKIDNEECQVQRDEHLLWKLNMLKAQQETVCGYRNKTIVVDVISNVKIPNTEKPEKQCLWKN